MAKIKWDKLTVTQKVLAIQYHALKSFKTKDKELKAEIAKAMAILLGEYHNQVSLQNNIIPPPPPDDPPPPPPKD